MKLRSLVPALVLSLATPVLGGCGEPSHLPALQREGTGIVQYYGQRLETLQRRADQLAQRGRTLAQQPRPGVQAAGQALQRAAQRLAEARRLVEGAEARIQASAAIGRPRELAALVDAMAKELGDATIVISDDIDAVESWVAYAERGVGVLPSQPSGPGAPLSNDHLPNPVAEPAAGSQYPGRVGSPGRAAPHARAMLGG